MTIIDTKRQFVFKQFDDAEIQTQFQRPRDIKFLLDHLETNEYIIAGVTGQIKQAFVIILLTNLHVIIMRRRWLLNPWFYKFIYNDLTSLNSSSGIAFTRLELKTATKSFIVNAVDNDKAYLFINELNQAIAGQENERILTQHLEDTTEPQFFDTEIQRLTRLHDHGIITDLDFENSRANLYYIYNRMHK